MNDATADRRTVLRADELPLRAELSKPDSGLRPFDEAEAVLEVRGVEAVYQSRSVLQDVYCHFPANTVTAIMGPSGGGKSTLIKILNRTLELTPGAALAKGAVLFHGRNIYAAGEDGMTIRKRIGIIHQRPVLFPMSILENVLFGARFHRHVDSRRARDYAENYLDLVGLLAEVKDRLSEPASKLSGGQQQRLCLARTLANRPEVILMDEPCSAIDPLATQRIEELILRLRERYTIVIVTHNLAQARRISEQALFLFAGRVIETGRTDRLFAAPRTDLARRFISGQIG